MAFIKISLAGTSRHIMWDPEKSLFYNLRANLYGTKDIKGYVKSSMLSQDKSNSAYAVINKASEGEGAKSPTEKIRVEHALAFEVLPEQMAKVKSHRVDGKPSQLYEIYKYAQQQDTDAKFKRYSDAKKKLDNGKDKRTKLQEEITELKSNVRTLRSTRMLYDFYLEHLNRIDAALNKQIEGLVRVTDDERLGKQLEASLKVREMLLEGGEVKQDVVYKNIQNEKERLSKSVASREKSSAKLAELQDSLVTYIDNHQDNTSLLKDLLNEIKIFDGYKEQYIVRADAAKPEKKHKPKIERFEIPGSKGKKYDWDLKGNMLDNLEKNLTEYLNDGKRHSKDRIKSANDMLAQIKQLREVKDPYVRDYDLLQIIRSENIQSHGFDKRASKLHALYRYAEQFVGQTLVERGSKLNNQVAEIDRKYEELNDVSLDAQEKEMTMLEQVEVRREEIQSTQLSLHETCNEAKKLVSKYKDQQDLRDKIISTRKGNNTMQIGQIQDLNLQGQSMQTMQVIDTLHTTLTDQRQRQISQTEQLIASAEAIDTRQLDAEVQMRALYRKEQMATTGSSFKEYGTLSNDKLTDPASVLVFKLKSYKERLVPKADQSVEQGQDSSPRPSK